MKKTLLLLTIIFSINFCKSQNDDTIEMQKILIQMTTQISQVSTKLNLQNDMESNIKLIDLFVEKMQEFKNKVLDFDQRYPNSKAEQDMEVKKLGEKFQQVLANIMRKIKPLQLKYLHNEKFKEMLRKIGKLTTQ